VAGESKDSGNLHCMKKETKEIEIDDESTEFHFLQLWGFSVNYSGAKSIGITISCACEHRLQCTESRTAEQI
jgi:hypothetical protein